MPFDEIPPSVLDRARVTNAERPPIIRIQLLEEYVDGWLSVDLDLNAEVGEEPLADASVITDHLVAKPTRFTVEGIVTDYPLRPSAATDGRRNVTQYQTYGQATDARINEARNAIDVIVARSETFPVDTPWGIYPTVVIRSAHFTEKGGSGAGLGLRIRLQLQALRIVEVPNAQSFQAPATGRMSGVTRGRVTPVVQQEERGLTGDELAALTTTDGRPGSYLISAVGQLNTEIGGEELAKMYRDNPEATRELVRKRADELAKDSPPTTRSLTASDLLSGQLPP